MAANKEGSTQEFLVRRKGTHICDRYCFPTKEITFFCFDCGDEVFRSQIGKHGNRKNPENGQWEKWYICKPCHKSFKDEIEKNRAPKVEGWILTETGWQKQGRFGVPSDTVLRRKWKKGY